MTPQRTRRHRQRHGRPAIPGAARRRRRTTFDITVFCEEPRAAYDRVQLTAFFSGKTRGRPVARRPTDFFERTRIDAAPRRSARSRSTVAAQRVTTVDGRDARATTSWCSRPAPIRSCRRFRAATGRGCFVYRTIEDLEAIARPRRRARDRRRDRRRPARPRSGEGAARTSGSRRTSSNSRRA